MKNQLRVTLFAVLPFILGWSFLGCNERHEYVRCSERPGENFKAEGCAGVDFFRYGADFSMLSSDIPTIEIDAGSSRTIAVEGAQWMYYQSKGHIALYDFEMETYSTSELATRGLQFRINRIAGGDVSPNERSGPNRYYLTFSADAGAQDATFPVYLKNVYEGDDRSNRDISGEDVGVFYTVEVVRKVNVHVRGGMVNSGSNRNLTFSIASMVPTGIMSAIVRAISVGNPMSQLTCEVSDGSSCSLQVDAHSEWKIPGSPEVPFLKSFGGCDSLDMDGSCLVYMNGQDREVLLYYY